MIKVYKIYDRKKKQFIEGSTDSNPSSSWCKHWWDANKDRELNGVKITDRFELIVTEVEGEEWHEDE